MKMRVGFLCTLICIVLITPCLLAENSLKIQVHFYQGKLNEGEQPTKNIEIFTAASRAEILDLKAQASGAKLELQAAIVDTLLRLTNMQAIDELFSFEKPWLGRVGRLAEVVSSEEATFLFVFVPKVVAPRELSLHTTIIRSKQHRDPLITKVPLNKELYETLATGKFGDKTERILDAELVFAVGDVTIVSIPAEGGVYFLYVALVADQGASQSLEFAGGPKALHEVTPIYPTELREKGVEGRVELLVGINKEGIVEAVKITKSLHPYLDNAAVQALMQWRFEPVFQNGKPVSAVITTEVNFNREVYQRQEEILAKRESRSEGLDLDSQPLLKEILEGSAEYCQKLLNSALEFICEETIHDVFHNYKTPDELKKSAVVLSLVGSDNLITQIGMTKFTAAQGRTERNEYVCDFLLIKKAGMIEGRRIILKENGRTLSDRSRHLEERRFSSLVPLLEPAKILGRNWQKLFDYRILKEEKIHGKESYVIEAKPKLGDAGGIEYGKIWVKKKDYQTLKIEITGLPLEGYETVLEELAQYNLKPKFITTFFYEVEKKGFAFPSRVELLVSYPYPGLEPQAYIAEKIRTTMRYDKYKFFSIDTQSVIK